MDDCIVAAATGAHRYRPAVRRSESIPDALGSIQLASCPRFSKIRGCICRAIDPSDSIGETNRTAALVVQRRTARGGRWSWRRVRSNQSVSNYIKIDPFGRRCRNIERRSWARKSVLHVCAIGGPITTISATTWAAIAGRTFIKFSNIGGEVAAVDGKITGPRVGTEISDSRRRPAK